MNKLPRFVIGYANYKKRIIKKEIPGMKIEKRKELINQIDRVLQGLERGLICIDEAMPFLVACGRGDEI